MELLLAAIIAYMFIRMFSLHGCLVLIMRVIAWCIVTGIVLVILWLA